ncbi:Phosphatidylinositol 4-kinase (PI4-kinase) (PtdIns-4-kinase) (PI4K-alpha) [Durusdinium trenchii]|uniref:Phosphatidylinositol 4-kinase (PI4-kinase) (PtdIns-4-kinase) (PI4K-alpha) n=1 Tax=Durusdinium trenchii TaxID=1381693 RepID=A0ABP0RZN8_9DINO
MVIEPGDGSTCRTSNQLIPEVTTHDLVKPTPRFKLLQASVLRHSAKTRFEAKKNFIESSAAYSLVVYFLQVKDRHNGNLMLLTSGHVVHIDFGFMLSNSPGGNMAFENSPFKLTQEILDVMDGECSEQYEYFRTLLIRGFLEARKHMERIVLQAVGVVRMMLVGSKMPCFREGADFVLSTLQDRFFCNLTEEACPLAADVPDSVRDRVVRLRSVRALGPSPMPPASRSQ